MKSNSYWENRANERMAFYHKNSDGSIFMINDEFNKSTKAIKLDVKNLFSDIFDHRNLSVPQVKELINGKVSTKELRGLREKINSVENLDLKKKVIQELNMDIGKSNITRLQALKASTLINTSKIADVQLKQGELSYINSVVDAYYKNIYDIQKGTGFDFDFQPMSLNKIEEILKKNWSGQRYAERVWNNTEVLSHKLEEDITKGLLKGKTSWKIGIDLEELNECGKMASARLIRTETTYVSNMAEMESYKECGINKYVFLATMDLKTSEVCREHDGKIYKVDKSEPGINLPPLHPWCRSTTMMYIDDKVYENLKKRSINPKTGEINKVPDDKEYDEWYKEHVLDKYGEQDSETIQSMIRDKEKYKINSVRNKSFTDFKEQKYNNDKGISQNETKFNNTFEGTGNPKEVKKLNEWLSDDKELLDEVTEWYKEKPEWWSIDPDNTDVFYRTQDEVKEIRKKAGESGGHHPHGLGLGGPEGQKLTPTGETAKVKNPTHSKVTGLQRRVINRIKKKLK